MTREDKRSAIAAAMILVGIAALFWVMPTIVLSLGDISPLLGGVAAALFMLSLFAVFWLRRFYLRGKSGSE